MKLIILSVLVFMAIAIAQVNAAVSKTSYYTSCSTTTSIFEQYSTVDQCAASACIQSNDTTGTSSYASMDCATMPTTASSGRLLLTTYSDSSCSGTPTSAQSYALGACINQGSSSTKVSCSQVITYTDTACKVGGTAQALSLGSCINKYKYQCSGVDKIKMSFMVLVALIAAMFML